MGRVEDREHVGGEMGRVEDREHVGGEMMAG